MKPETLWLIWSVISEISTEAVTDLSHDALVKKLLFQLNRRICLSLNEQSIIRSYLRTREPLIREMFEYQVI